MTDFKGEAVATTGVFVSDLGVLQFVINGKLATREDYNALTLARISAALEVLAEDVMNGEGEDDEAVPPPPGKPGIFGV